jgi:hypothetical protein
MDIVWGDALDAFEKSVESAGEIVRRKLARKPHAKARSANGRARTLREGNDVVGRRFGLITKRTAAQRDV